MNKVGKSIRPFRYDLNQISYDYTVEVTNRFKRSDLIDRVPEEPWMEVCDIVQKAGIKTIPKEKKCKKALIQWMFSGHKTSSNRAPGLTPARSLAPALFMLFTC